MKKSIFRLLLFLVTFQLGGPQGLWAQKDEEQFPYEPFFSAKLMEGIPCAMQIEWLMSPKKSFDPAEKSQILDQLAACESEPNGSYAYISRKLAEGNDHINKGNYFLGWDCLLKGQEKLDELPPYAPFRLFFLSNLGNAYQETGAMALSIPCFKEALKLEEESKVPIRSNLLNIYTKLSGAYFALGNRDSSLYWSREGVSHCREFPETNWYASSLNNLGMRFQSYSQSDSALYYFRTALEVQNNLPPPTGLTAAILDNLAGIYLEKAQYDSAYHYYRASYDFGRAHQIKHRMAAGGGKSITTLLEKPGWGQSELETAREIMAAIDSMVQASPSTAAGKNFGYVLLAKVSLMMAEGNLPQTHSALDRYLAFRDSLTETVNQRRIKALEGFLVDSAEKYTDQLTLADLEAKNSKVALRYFIIIGVLALLLLIFIGVMLRRKVLYQRTELQVKDFQDKLNQMELENASLKKKELEQELVSKKRDMDDLALEMRVRSKAREDLIDQLEGILKTSAPSTQLRVLLNDLKMQADHQQISDVRLEKAKEVESGFKDRLKEKFPKLTRTDVELCELFLLEIPVKEIASIRKITPESVRMGKYRVRKKLGLTGEEGLRAFLKKV